MDKPIVELRHFFKRYHENEVLKDVSISFDMSSIHSIVGENGAGKSTLTKILCGVIPKTKGVKQYKESATPISIERSLMTLLTDFEQISNI